MLGQYEGIPSREGYPMLGQYGELPSRCWLPNQLCSDPLRVWWGRGRGWEENPAWLVFLIACFDVVLSLVKPYRFPFHIHDATSRLICEYNSELNSTQRIIGFRTFVQLSSRTSDHDQMFFFLPGYRGYRIRRDFHIIALDQEFAKDERRMFTHLLASLGRLLYGSKIEQCVFIG